jgi:hypothetical protein
MRALSSLTCIQPINRLKFIFSHPSSRALLALALVLVTGFVFNADGTFLKLGTRVFTKENVAQGGEELK